MPIQIPELIWDLVGLIEFCIIFAHIQEKSLPLFYPISIFLTPERIHYDLINLLMNDLAKTANNCSIIDYFEHM